MIRNQWGSVTGSVNIKIFTLPPTQLRVINKKVEVGTRGQIIVTIAVSMPPPPLCLYITCIPEALLNKKPRLMYSGCFVIINGD